MVKYNPKEWFALIFHTYSRNVMKTLFPSMVFIAAYTAVITYLICYFFHWNFQSTTTVHSLLGIVLGLFLVFRTNTAYDRWWEGRKQWGSLVNCTRNLAMKINAYLPKQDREGKVFFALTITNFVFALKEHLRKGVKIDELEVLDKAFHESLSNFNHIPNQIASSLHNKINELYKDGIFTEFHFISLNTELTALTDILGACERIKNTPIPYSYSMFIKKFIFLFTITLPLGFVTLYFYWTIAIVVLLFYILLSVELIAEEIEDPFGGDINDLPTNEIAIRIKSNIREILL